jgi:hypothetical protein
MWGDPRYPALDVLLDDCSRQLFWHYELEETKNGARPWSLNKHALARR